MIRIAVPGVVTLLVVMAYLALNGWDRSSVPLQTMILTERELAVQVTAGSAPGDDSGVQLRLQIDHRADPLDARNWLTDDRLRLLGFTLNVPAGAPEASYTYDAPLPRVGWVVLEYNGPAFVEIERRRALEQAKTGPWRLVVEPSRLVPVDAGPEFEPLRAKYDRTHLIVRAVVGVSYLDATRGGPLVYGRVREVIPATLSVPRRLRPVVDALPPHARTTEEGPHSPHAPRFDAEVASGPLGVLYVRDIRRAGG